MSTRIGKRATIVTPAVLRKKYTLEEGSQVNVEVRAEGILLRPIVTLRVEIYSEKKRAEFILNSAIPYNEYINALEQVRGMGIDAEEIPQEKPITRL